MSSLVAAENTPFIYSDEHASIIEIPVELSGNSYRIKSLLFSSFSLSMGVIDLYMFLFQNIYIFHPYFAVALCIGGTALLASTILAIRGK